MWHVRAHTHTHTQHVSKYTFQPGDIQETTRWVQGWCWDTSAYLDTRCTQHFLLHWTLCCAEVLRPAQVNNAFPGRCAFKIPQDLAWWKMCWVELCSIHPHEYHQQSVKTHKLLRQACWCLLTAWGDKLAGKVQTTSCVLNGALMGTASEAFAGQLSQTSSRTQNLFHELAMCIFPCVLFIKITASQRASQRNPTAWASKMLSCFLYHWISPVWHKATWVCSLCLKLIQFENLRAHTHMYKDMGEPDVSWISLYALKIFKLKGQN